MGRGRRGIIDQSQKNNKSSPVARKNQPDFVLLGDKKITSRVAIPCEFVENLKKMDPRYVAQALLQN